MIRPIVKLFSYPIGFFASVIAGIVAFVIPWFVFGVDREYVKEVFQLYSYEDFRVAIAMVFLTLFISRFIIRSINRIAISYQSRKAIFIIASIGNIITLPLFINYINTKDNQSAYYFGFFIVGIIYFKIYNPVFPISKP